MTDDEKLIYDMKQKRNGAFEKTVNRYTPYVSTVAYNTADGILMKEDIEEIVLDTFVSLWKNLKTFDCEKGSLRIYLGTIARNLAKRKCRTVHINTELDENIIAPQSNPYIKIEQNEEYRMMTELLHELGEADSEIFMRYYYYNEKISYISRVMSIKTGTVKSKLSRGRKELRKILERRDNDE